MENLKCFDGDIKTQLIDREPFRIKHNLADHPALTLENISKIILTHPQDKVMYSKALDHLNINFDQALVAEKEQFNIHDIVETIRTTNSYIAVRNVELNPTCEGLFQDILSDVERFMKINKTGNKAHVPMLWLFIASPGAITPFHFDRYSNFIMQVRGSKELAVFPPGHEAVVSIRDTEAYLDWDVQTPPWRDEMETYAHKFNFKAGEAVHIPYTSGHYVKNGMDDVSITLSVFYHSNETLRWSKAMRLNNRLRRKGMTPTPAKKSLAKDAFKATIFPYANKLTSVFSKLSS